MESVTPNTGRTWLWFQAHARSRYALWWLAATSFADAVFFPVPPEVFLVSLLLAHPTYWRRYLPVALISSLAGATTAYLIAHLLFKEVGAPVLAFYGATSAFREARHVLHNHVFLTMFLGNFSPIPDKVFIYAAGFLGAPYWKFIGGYALGRGLRMSAATYLTHRFGAGALAIFREYFSYVGLALVALAIIYAMVHWHLLGF